MDVKTKGNGGLASFLGKRKTKRMIFFACLVILPIIQFSICYIYVNINSFILAFQNHKYSRFGLGYVVTFAKFDNFKEAWGLISERMFMFENSLQLAFWTICVGLTLAVLFSYYIYKKYPLADLFRVVLFIPKIMSGVVFCLLYKYLSNEVYVHIATTYFGQPAKMLGILDNPETKLAGVLFFNVWIGFGVNVLMFTGSMSGIDESIVESAQLDGANTVQEFFYITFPLIWPTFVSFLTICFAGLFTDQMHLHTLFGTQGTTLSTFGYYLYINSAAAELIPSGKTPSFSVLSAMGLMLTAVMLPTILGLRKALRKLGPSVD